MDVSVRCLCPPKGEEVRHPEGDTVTLRDTLSFVQATACRNAIYLLKHDDPDAGSNEILAVLTEQYLLLGVESWTVVDGFGKPVPPTKGAIRATLLEDDEAAMLVADAADGLYSARVMLPLLNRGQSSSPAMPTPLSTSATTSSGPESRTPSSPSSTSTTRTAATGRTSRPRGGGSSSSRSSKSAA